MAQEREWTGSEIAVVGLACRFPKSPDARSFWDNIVSGVECVTHFTYEELLAERYPAHVLDAPSFIRAGAILEDIGCFDAGLFGFTKREAELLDPQHRFFLELSWQAMEDAGYSPRQSEGRVGVFAGCMESSYLRWRLMRNKAVMRTSGEQLNLFTDKDFLATRTAYKLNLTGPCINVTTACSTSLVAIHTACQSLLNGECDMALAGGASIGVPQTHGYVYQEGGIYSPDGHCRTFDAKAAGTLRGAGVGVVTLRRLEDALADGAPIYAVVLGSTVNNDGADKVGFTAPGVNGQAEAIAEAQSLAGISPDSVGLIEAHGTATPMGDPIEVRALTQVFREHTDRVGYCALGSVKSNIGHTDAAAGVAGFIKATMALHDRKLPPSLHFEEPNPELSLSTSPFFVPTRALDWEAGDTPRRAGVSSFGIGGTNAHIVLEEPPEPEPADPSPRTHELLVVSAETEAALIRARENLAGYLEAHPEAEPADVAYTLAVGRHAFACRAAWAFGDRERTIAALRGEAGTDLQTGTAETRARTLYMMFSGQGAQYPGMAADLYGDEPVFATHLDRCLAVLDPLLDGDPRKLLLEPGNEDDARALAATDMAQPLLFALEYALAQTWLARGVQPTAMIGHSLGEYVAATLAGVFQLDAALALVVARGRLMASCEPGEMLTVSTSEPTLSELLPDSVVIATINAPDRLVASGPASGIAALIVKLDEAGIPHRRLQTSHAYHSPMMEPILDSFVAEVHKARPARPQIPFISNTSGTWIKDEEATSPMYWARHLRGTVRFHEGLTELFDGPNGIFLEVGPGATLVKLVRRHDRCGRETVLVASLPGAGSDRSGSEAFVNAHGRLWCSGWEIDWANWYGEEMRHRLRLPTYPFQREAYWVRPDPGALTPYGTKPGQGPTEVNETGAQTEKPSAPSGTPPVAAPPVGQTRIEAIEGELTRILAELVGLTPEEVPVDENFLELGIDSLAMMQLSRRIQDELEVEVPFRALMEEHDTVGKLAAHLDPLVEKEIVVAAPVSAEQAFAGAGLPLPDLPADSIPGQLQGHLRAMADLIARMQVGAGSDPRPLRMELRPFSPDDLMTDGIRAQIVPNAFVAYKPAETDGAATLTPRQQAAFEKLVDDYTRFTAGSKAFIAENRGPFADNRNSVGFSRMMKELTYQIVAAHSEGGHFTDVDGNDLIDLGMGFGVHLFGNNPSFIREAIESQLAKGLHLGPQMTLAADLARLICRMTGVERVAYSNTGTEAVMAGLRVARTITGRKKLVIFEGAYHGTFDGVLVRTGKAPNEPKPLSPGVLGGFIEDIIYLPFADKRSLEAIEELGSTLAAVIVEPVQSRRPDLRPLTFLRELRRITEANGTALIFDEVITGFRMHPGGAQKLFDIQADMVTYGKVAGGGMPIGILAGRAKYLDAIDGGAWSFGDDSYPRGLQTLFAGTFCKHPLTLAAGHAALAELARRGPELQARLNAVTDEMIQTLNRFFDEEGYPVLMTNFGSLFRFFFPPSLPYTDLFFLYLMMEGVYTWEGRNCFLSTEHDDEDIARIVEAVRVSAAKMREAGFFPEKGAHDLTVAAAVTEPEPLPLTPAQSEIWVMAQMGGAESRAYHLSVTADIEGDLSEEMLDGVLQTLVARHNALRLTVDARGRSQSWSPSLRIPLERGDLTGLSEDARKAETDAFRDAPFDLEQGPIARFKLFRTGPRARHLAMVFHHIAVDGWSSGILGKELVWLLNARRSGADDTLPTVMQFSTYAHKQVRAMEETGQDARAYWLDLLGGPLPRLTLPRDRTRAVETGNEASRTGRLLEGDWVTELRRSAREHGSTMFMMLMAGFELLLHRLSGQSDVIIGIPSAGRSFDGDENMIGHCVNMLAQRSVLRDDPSIADFLARVRGQWLGASNFQFFPLSRIQNELDLSRGAPLFDVTFNMERAAPTVAATTDAGRGSELDIRVATPTPGSIQYKLGIDVIDDGKSLQINCTHRTDLFEPDTIARWLGYYETLLRGLVSDSTRKLSTLAIMSESQLGEVVHTFNQILNTPYQGQDLLHRLFERAVAASPDAPFLEVPGCSPERLTYGAVNDRANKLARLLRARGVGPEKLVGLHARRVPGLTIATLAVFKAGGGFVPLEPGHPDQRLLEIAEQSRLELTLSTLPDRLPENCGEVLALAEDGSPRGGFGDIVDGTDLSGPEHLDQVAYVMYTSGSTGKPKGIVTAHRGLANRLCWTHHDFPIEPSGALLHEAGYGFDISVWEMFDPAMNGARLVMLPDIAMGDPEAILEIMVSHRVTHIHMVPSLLRTMLSQGMDKQSAPDLELIYVGGEKVTIELQEDCLEALGGGQLIQVYGPTEASITTTTIDVVENLSFDMPSVGRSISNTKVYILDTHGNPVPPGISGEICLGGIHLARGYLNRPDLTAEKFVPDPFDDGHRIYHTGDLGCYNPEGGLVFLGRIDRQIKIRGFRIEPGEIEVVLERLDEIEEALVTVVTRRDGSPELAAHMVLEDKEGDLDAAVAPIREKLVARLPSYLVPTYLIPLTAFPLNKNEKIDYRALPIPERPARSAAPLVAPRDAFEEVLAGIFADHLETEEIGIHDDFFDLGGNSLMAAQVKMDITELLRVELPLPDFFANPTVAGLVELLGRDPRERERLDGVAGALIEMAAEEGGA